VIICVVNAAFRFLYFAECRKPDSYRISRFRGHVVGKSLSFLQYRWLRRRFTAVGTRLTLARYLEDHERNENRRETTIDGSGAFDFGELQPGRYALSVTMPGQDTVEMRFLIDPAAHNTDVLIDASPAIYCDCCGWDFEPR
jgi:hypothetical protein